MNKKHVSLTAFVLLLLVSTLVGTFPVNLVTANPMPGTKSWYQTWLIKSPQNKTYGVNSVPLTFTVITNGLQPAYFYILDFWRHSNYRVDGLRVDLKPVNVTTRIISDDNGLEPYTEYTLDFNTTLYSLADGLHTLSVKSGPHKGAGWSNPPVSELTIDVYFSVKYTIPITIWTLDGTAFNTTNLSLNFGLSTPVSWVGYSIDAKQTQTLTEYKNDTELNGSLYSYRTTDNTILTGLSDGFHILVLYAKTTSGNSGQSKIFSFKVASQGQKTESSALFPTTWIVVAAIASVAIVSAGLLVYFKKRNHAKQMH